MYKINKQTKTIQFSFIHIYIYKIILFSFLIITKKKIQKQINKNLTLIKLRRFFLWKEFNSLLNWIYQILDLQNSI